MQQKIWVLTLILFLVLPVAIFTPQTSNSVHAQPTFNKPATTYSGTATVTCFTSPDSSDQVIRGLLQETENEMLIMVYAFTNWFLIKEIHDALARNSSMEIKIIVSWKWASASERSYTKACFYNLSQNAAFSAGNLQLFYSEDTYLEFSHAKFMIFDQQHLVVESCNWAKSGIPPNPTAGNREWGVVIQQPDVVDYFYQTFVDDLFLPNVEPYVPDIGDERAFGTGKDTGPYPAPFTNQTFSGSMDIQCVLSPDNDIGAITALIDSANTTLDVQQMYSKMEWDGNPNDFNEAILRAQQRGVACRVMLDNRSSGMQAVGEMFVANGVAVLFSNQTLFGWTHNKGVIVDNKLVLISSINWSYESTHENREAGVIITHTGIANYFAQIFQWDWDHGTYLSTAQPPTPTLNGPSTTIDGLVSLNWSVSSTSGIAHYQIQASNNSNFGTILIQVNRTGTTYTADVTSFGEGVYYFRIRAIDTNDTPSAWSNVLSATYSIPLPPIPIEFLIIGAAVIIIIVIGGIIYRWSQKRK